MFVSCQCVFVVFAEGDEDCFRSEILNCCLRLSVVNIGLSVVVYGHFYLNFPFHYIC